MERTHKCPQQWLPHQRLQNELNYDEILDKLHPPNINITPESQTSATTLPSRSPSTTATNHALMEVESTAFSIRENLSTTPRTPIVKQKLNVPLIVIEGKAKASMNAHLNCITSGYYQMKVNAKSRVCDERPARGSNYSSPKTYKKIPKSIK